MYEFKTNQEFDAWLSQVQSKQDRLVERLKGSVDLSGYNDELKAVRALSEWVLDNFPSVSDIKGNPVLLDELACYFGEVYRKALSSEWAVELNDEGEVFFGTPVIVCDPPPPISPKSSVITMVKRKNPEFIFESISKRLNRADLN